MSIARSTRSRRHSVIIVGFEISQRCGGGDGQKVGTVLIQAGLTIWARAKRASSGSGVGWSILLFFCLLTPTGLIIESQVSVSKALVRTVQYRLETAIDVAMESDACGHNAAPTSHFLHTIRVVRDHGRSHGFVRKTTPQLPHWS
jgi:hypothetical protein